MKKFFAVVVAALTLCLFSVGFSGCGEDKIMEILKESIKEAMNV